MNTRTTVYGTKVTKWTSYITFDGSKSQNLVYWTVYERPSKEVLIGYSKKEFGLIKEVKGLTKDQAIQKFK